MVGHIPNTGQFWNLLGQRFLDPILEGDTDSTTTLTSPAEAQDSKLIFSHLYK
jgi:hypothetical protein